MPPRCLHPRELSKQHTPTFRLWDCRSFTGSLISSLRSKEIRVVHLRCRPHARLSNPDPPFIISSSTLHYSASQPNTPALLSYQSCLGSFWSLSLWLSILSDGLGVFSSESIDPACGWGSSLHQALEIYCIFEALPVLHWPWNGALVSVGSRRCRDF